MKANDAAERCALIVRLIRFLRDWSQQKLANAAGMDRREIFAYESGEYVPGRDVLERLARAARLPLGAVEIAIPVLLWLQRLNRRPNLHASEGVQVAAAEAGDLVNVTCRGEALVVQLCNESLHAGAADPARALALAEAAFQVARQAGDGRDALHLQGHALLFLANAQRVGGNLNGADATFARAGSLLRNGAEDSHLPPSRPLDLLASLRRDQGRFAEALDLLDQALACGTPGCEGHILLNKAFTLEQMGDVRGAVTALQQAASRIDGEREPRQRTVLLFNLAVLLCHTERFDDAAKQLPELRVLIIEQENRIDQMRLPWLESRILAGQGDLPRAVAALERVQGEFAALGNFYDEARATLDLARLYLRQGRTDKTKDLAARAEPVFREMNVAPRVLESVLVFLEAARQEAATLELLDQALQALGEGRRGR
jgi:tetratricopeptide (TPR) repeat protein/transcriptional regulator with XRE-family HTH domain